ncbi:hypothetical protein [Synechococcus elongatus]|uniref:hypothetical protein n=1 Tax=Synechococcus elongatus TaxID=32046 RepID=UPI000F7D76EC|nr:hypothetical protein [Synechococcus elongatus]
MQELLITFLISWATAGCIFGLFCSTVAGSKGHNTTSWFLAGFFFNFIALIAAAGLSDTLSQEYLYEIANKLPRRSVNY